MAANFNVGKIFSTVERMLCCKVSIEINIVSLKEPAFFGNAHTTSEILLKQWVTLRSPVKINTVSFKEWMTATLFVTQADTLFQSIGGSN